ncbi:MAG: hypothetical protein ACXWC9_04265 [Pseudobdellovibrionaceae bacterium]
MKSFGGFQKEMSLCLLESRDAKGFVVKAFGIFMQAHPKTSFAEMARTMGFASRSFVRQLSLGEKAPNLANHQRIALGLRMTSEACDFFSTLIEKQHFGSSPQLDKKIEAAELKLRRSLEKNVRRIRKTDPVPFERWPYIYASLGSRLEGRSYKDILRISGQEPSVVTEILQHLVQNEIIDWDEKQKKYYPKEEVIDIGELGNSRILKSLFKQTTMEALRRVDSELGSREALFYNSIFSVRRSQMPDLTRDLQKLLSQYASSAENSNGEEIAILSAAMLPLR